jgi:DNA mismatch repair protein MutS
LFSVAPAAPPAPRVLAKESAVEARLKEALPDEMTPMEALRLVYELKDLLKG